MRRYIFLLLISSLLFVPYYSKGNPKVILNPKTDIQEQLKTSNTTYIVKKAIDLQGKAISIPEGSVIEFKRKGTLSNGMVSGNGTTLKGKVKLGCELAGTYTNTEIPVSWLCINDRKILSQQIASIFNLKQKTTVNVDKDITLDGTRKDVGYVAFSGNGRIRNSCSYRVKGDVLLKDVTISDFETYRELFLDMREISCPVNVDIEGLTFDGNWNVSRFLYCPYQNFSEQSNIIITGSNFTRVKNYVIQFRPACTGRITDNIIEDIGTDVFSNVVGLHLGDSDDDSGRMCAQSFVIEDNVFKNFLVPFSNVDDGREAHALLIYGHGNEIKNNTVSDMHTKEGRGSDTGRDCEGIYIKGGKNSITGNKLVDCIGTSPDGAITVKSAYTGNVICGNTIIHQYGIGIQCYTPDSRIEKNEIRSSGKSEACIATLANTNTIIADNELTLTDGSRQFHAAVELIRSKDIEVKNNKFVETSGVLCTYGCNGSIMFTGNEIGLTGKQYGENTYYTAPFEFHDDKASFAISGNRFDVNETRASQLIETPEGFRGSLTFDNNMVSMGQSDDDNSFFSYLVRNVDKLSVGSNQYRTKKNAIRKMSNKHNIGIQ